MFSSLSDHVPIIILQGRSAVAVCDEVSKQGIQRSGRSNRKQCRLRAQKDKEGYTIERREDHRIECAFVLFFLELFIFVIYIYIYL